jgi:hypothetical protein
LSFKTPQKQLEEFRASKPEYLVHILEGVPSAADFDALQKSEYMQDPELYKKHCAEYESILRRVPHAVRDRDRRQLAQFAKLLVSPSPKGRPKKEELAQEICDLRAAKWRWGRIAKELNEKYGKGTTTEEAARRLSAAYQSRLPRSRKTPEEQLAEFEASHPEWLISIFRRAYSYSELDSDPDFDSNSGSDFDRWRKSEYSDFRILKASEDEYEEILKLIPERWREYQESKKRNLKAVFTVDVPGGRPSKDEEAEEFKKMAQTMSLAQVARENLTGTPEFAKATIQGRRTLVDKEKDRIRKLLSRRRGAVPEKM